MHWHEVVYKVIEKWTGRFSGTALQNFIMKSIPDEAVLRAWDEAPPTR